MYMYKHKQICNPDMTDLLPRDNKINFCSFDPKMLP